MDPYTRLVEEYRRLSLGDWSEFLARVSLVIAVLVAAWLANWIAKQVIVRTLRRLVRHTANRWDDLLVEHRVFHRLSHLAPAVVIHFSAGILFPLEDEVAGRLFLTRVALSYMLVVGALVCDAFLSVLVGVAQNTRGLRDKPVKSYLQVVKILLWITTVILVLSTMMGREPWAFLTGLGALTAILLLVFKDSILGLVASIQIAALDLVRPGDWIEMPAFQADGDVEDISLTTVKVRNWDKTVTAVPSYALVSSPFRNWRGMSESGGRRIKRSLSLDMTSVRFVDGELLARLRKIQLLAPYLERKDEELRVWNETHRADPDSPVNGRRLTNLGCFRAYLEAYLRASPLCHPHMTFLVRQLPPGPTGIPLEIYFFSKEQRWAHYEAFVADIFDHVLAAAPEFGLRVFQQPTGADLRGLRVGGEARD